MYKQLYSQVTFLDANDLHKYSYLKVIISKNIVSSIGNTNNLQAIKFSSRSF